MGDVLPERIGRYRILGELGRGAMGTVYRGRDEGLERDVAVKVVSVGDADEEALARFHREAKAAGRLQHPNIVTIYEFGEHEGRPFMVLELLEGVDLQHAIVGGLKPDPKVTLPIVLQVLSGLGHAHDHGVVHRDVKPSNVFLPRGRPAKLMDFGIARLGGATGMGFTTAGMVVGTPNYMSPEQAMGSTVDGRSDLFSVGLIVYELVTGERAYGGDSLVSVLYKIVHDPPDLRLIPRGPVWEPLRLVVDKALAKQPSGRYPDASSMSEDLRAALLRLGGSVDLAAPSDLALMPRAALRTSAIRQAPTRHEAPEPEPLTLAALSTKSMPLQRPRAGHLALWLVGGLAAVVLGVIGAGVVWLNRPVPRPPAALAEPSPSTPNETPPSSRTSVESTALTASSPMPNLPSVTPRPTVGATPPSAPPSSAAASLPAGTPSIIAARPTPTPTLMPPPVVEPTLEAPGVTGEGGSTEARLTRARAFMEKARYTQALEEARAVLRAEPMNGKARDIAAAAEAAALIEDSVHLARIALDEGRTDDAMEHIRRGLTANPSEPRLLVLFREAAQ